MLVMRVLVSDERRQLFFFSTSTRRDVRISREELGHSVFFSGMAVVIQDFRLRSTSRLICRISRAI